MNRTSRIRRESGGHRAGRPVAAARERLMAACRAACYLIVFALAISLPPDAHSGQGEIMFVNGFEGTGNVPQLVPVDDQAVAAESLLQIDIDTSSPANQAGLAFSLLDPPAGMAINSSSGVIAWTPSIQQVGIESITVRVEDLAGLSNTLSFGIEVVDSSASPLIAPIADATALAGEMFALQVDAADPDPADVLDFSLDGAPAGLVIDPASGLLEWVPSLADVGAYTVTVRATDPAGRFDTEDFRLGVVADNQAPELIDIDDRGAAPGVAVQLIAVASDPDGDPLSWSLAERPAGMSIVPDSGAIGWTPTTLQLGPHPVTVEVRDPSGFVDTTSFEIFVDFNRAPVAVDDAGFRVERGDTLSLPAPGVLVNDTDPNDDPLSAQRIVDPVRGTLTLNADGGFDYTPDNPTGTIGFASKWSYVVPNGSNAWLPIIADLDDDPQAEVLVARGQGNSLNIRVTALDGVTGQIDWQVLFRNRELSTNPPPPVVADIDLDGMPELLILGGEPDSSPTAVVKIYAFEHNGTLKWISDELPQQFYLGGVRRSGLRMGRAALTVADLDGDGLPEILAAPSNGPVGYHVWDHEGRTLQTVQAQGTQTQTSATRVTVVDLDLDGTPEIVVGNVAWSNTGEQLWERLANFGHVQASDFPLVANLDDDPFPELVRTRGSLPGPGNLVAWNHDGTDLMTPAGVPWEVARPFGFNTAPISLADVDADGYADVLAPDILGSNRFEVLDGRDGTVKWSKTVPTRSSGATVFDMDRDGFPEVVFFDADSDLHVWDGRDGTERLVFDADGGATMPPDFTLPVFADIDADGQAELATSMGFTLANSPAISIWESPMDDWAPARAVWNAQRYHVTNINDDLSVPARQRPHWLLPGLNQYMVNARLPDARNEEQDSFTYLASDGELASNPATVEITILPPNSPPRILSTPPALASPGFEYVYTVLAVDADAGELLNFALAEGPAGMSIDPQGRLSWTPGAGDLGRHPVVISVSDTLDVAAFQNFFVDVVAPVSVPALAGLDEAQAISALHALSLRADPLRDTFSDTVAAGEVAAQSPPAGTAVAAGSGVVVEISRGPVPVQVPGVQGLRLADALGELSAAGLSAGGVVSVNDASLPRDTVRLQNPPRGALLAPGAAVDLEVSGGPRAIFDIVPAVVPAGATAGIEVSIRDTDGSPLDPQPAVTLALDVDPAALDGTPPTLSGSTITTFADSQGPFRVEASFNGETVSVQAVIAQPISDGPGADVYSEFVGQLARFRSLIDQLIAAVDLGDGPAILTIDQALADLESDIDVRRLRTLSPIAPDGGVPPDPDTAEASGFGPGADDRAFAGVSLDLLAVLQQMLAVSEEGTAPDLVLNALNQELAASASALTVLDPEVYGVLDASAAIVALLGTGVPRLVVADIRAVRQALRDQGLITAGGEAAVGRFTLPGIMTATQIRTTIVNDFYVPYLGQVARTMGTIAAADLLQPYVNGGAIVGIVTGGSLALHVFEIPNSVIEGFGFNPRLSPNNAVTMIGPALIDSVQDALGDLPSAESFKDLNTIMDTVQAQIDNANAVGTAWDEANSSPMGVRRGCILDNFPTCRQLIYPNGFASVYSVESGLSLPAPVAIIVRNLESGGMALFVANFVPTREN